MTNTTIKYKPFDLAKQLRHSIESLQGTLSEMQHELANAKSEALRIEFGQIEAPYNEFEILDGAVMQAESELRYFERMSECFAKDFGSIKFKIENRT